MPHKIFCVQTNCIKLNSFCQGNSHIFYIFLLNHHSIIVLMVYTLLLADFFYIIRLNIFNTKSSPETEELYRAILLCVCKGPSHRGDTLCTGIIEEPVVVAQRRVEIPVIHLHFGFVEKHCAKILLDDCTFAVIIFESHTLYMPSYLPWGVEIMPLMKSMRLNTQQKV